MIVVILGPDASMARAEVRRRMTDADPSGQSTTVMDGKISGLHDVQMAVASIGFFSAGRVIVVEDLIARLGKQGARDGGSVPDWTGLFAAVPGETTLVLVDPSLVTLPAGVKKALPSGVSVTVCDPPRGRELIRWIKARATDQDSSMDDQTARLLAETLYPQNWASKPNNPAFDRPPDLELLGNEIAKLAIAAAPRPIAAADVQTLTMQGDTDQIFAFIDAASSGRIAHAIFELDRLLAAGEDPYKLLAQLSQTVELLVVMSASAGRQAVDVGRSLKLPNANRMTAIARSLRGQPSGLPARAAEALKTAGRRS